MTNRYLADHDFTKKHLNECLIHPLKIPMSTESLVEKKGEIPAKETTEIEEDISFPSHPNVTYAKLRDTVAKFVELGGGPFTQEQINKQMSELGNIKVVIQRLLPYAHYLGLMERSRIGKGGLITYKLKPELRKRLEADINEFDAILCELFKQSPAYLAIWTYSAEEKSNKFLVSAFESYLKHKRGLKFSSSGLSSFLNALDKVKLLVLSGGFISLEGITSPLSAKITGEDMKGFTTQTSGTPSVLQGGSEGIAPGMTITVNVNLDYRQQPDLQREYMQWLEKMSSKPNVMISVRGQEPRKGDSKSQRETG